MDFGATCCDQRYLRHKQHDPRGHHDAVQVNNASSEIRRVEERFEIVSAGETREYDQWSQNCCEYVQPPIINAGGHSGGCCHWDSSVWAF